MEHTYSREHLRTAATADSAGVRQRAAAAAATKAARGEVKAKAMEDDRRLLQLVGMQVVCQGQQYFSVTCVVTEDTDAVTAQRD